MPFRGRVLFSVCLINAILIFGGCGRFGKKPEPAKVLNYGSDVGNCLGDFKSAMKLYPTGDVEQDKWASGCDCILKSVSQFQENIKPSSAQGYTQEDIKNFANEFILKNKKVLSDEFVDLIFEIKTIFFGGDKDFLKSSEINEITQFLQYLKGESIDLLPYLVDRAKDPSYENLLALAKFLEEAGIRFSQHLKYNPQTRFTRAEIQKLSIELSKIMDSQSLTDEQLNLMASVKVFLVGGSPDSIESDQWEKLFRLSSSLGGILLAGAKIENQPLIGNREYRAFLMDLVSRIRKSIDAMIDWHGGILPLSLLDHVIDDLPSDQLTINRTVLKNTLRPLLKRFIQSQSPEAIDKFSTEHIFSLLTQWNQGQTQLERLYEAQNLDKTGVNLQRFVSAATQYAQNLNKEDATTVNHFVWLARKFRPLYLENDDQISFTLAQRYSFHHFTNLFWMRMLAELFIQNYGSYATENKAVLADLSQLLDDFKDLGYELKVFDPSIPNGDKKHFQYMNLFTYASNGDGYIDVDEVTYYIPFLFSAKKLSAKIRKTLSSICSEPEQDSLGNNWLDVDCFRQEFISRHADFWDHFPDLIRTYDNLSGKEKGEFLKAIEKSARRYGYTDLPVGTYDLDAMSLVLFFVDSLFTRFDRDGNQVLDLDEVLSAYPVFKMKVASYGKLDPNDDDTIQAVLTYMMKYGIAPNKEDFWSMLHFLWWMARKPFWELSAGRDILLKVISALNRPERVPREYLSFVHPEFQNGSLRNPLFYNMFEQ